MAEGELSNELVVPGIGTVVDLNDPAECSFALDDIRNLESQLRLLKSALTEAIVAEAQRQGTKTLHFPGGKATLRFGDERHYDAEEIELGLRAAGMPEERIREIVKETVVYKVDAVRAKQAEAANPEYAKVIEEHSELRQMTPSVSVQRRPK